MAYINPVNQSLVNQADNRYQLAQAMGMNALQPQQGVASPLGALAKILSVYFAKRGMDQAQSERQSTLQEQQSQNRMEMANALSAYRGDTPYQPSPMETFGPEDQLPPGLKMEGQGQDRGALLQALMESENPQYQQMAFKAMLGGSELPSSIQEWQMYNSMAPQDQERYLQMKRANKFLDVGTGFVVPSQTEPTQVRPVASRGLKPSEEPGYKADVKTAEKTAEAEVKKIQNKPKVIAAISDLERQTNVVQDTINKALETISPWSTGAGALFDFLPESEAGKLKNYLDTIRANVGFDKLQRMRDMSPTGGALGQVSELENRLLQAVNGALDPRQSDQLRENLMTIKDLYSQVLEEKRQAFTQDYGETLAPRETSYRSAEDVKSAFQNGEISEEQALDVLRTQFGFDE